MMVCVSRDWQETCAQEELTMIRTSVAFNKKHLWLRTSKRKMNSTLKLANLKSGQGCLQADLLLMQWLLEVLFLF